MSENGGVIWRAGDDESNPYHRLALISCFIIGLQVGVLLLLERSWFCSCGSIRLWQGSLDPVQNSQQLTDPYSFLHIAFGCGLFMWLKAIRPHWHFARRASYAVASSAIWEVMENLPFVIGIFGAEGSALHYSGDSIANSLADTLAVGLGFWLASRLPTVLAISTIAALEGATFGLIGDSVLVGLLRMTASITS